MGVFEVDFVRQHVDLEDFPIVVETGTNLGYSTDILLRLFRKVYTIEIDRALYEGAARKYRHVDHVECLLGDSAEEIARLLPKLDAPTLFFLDAHFSGDDRTDWDRSNWKGYGVRTGHRSLGSDGTPTSQEQVPLDVEIDAIFRGFPHRCVLYCDDARNFGEDGQGLRNKGFLGEDWSHLNLNSILLGVAPRLEFTARSDSQLLIVLKAAEPV
jgi:hypothetical protein